MRAYKLSDYSRHLSQCEHLTRLKISEYERELADAKTESMKNYWIKAIEQARTAQNWMHWQLMLINPD